VRILVTGGRDFQNKKALWDILDALNNIEAIIHGKARGADRLAEEWAVEMGRINMAFPANWDKHGNSAGPIRNQQMLDEGKPDIVISCPGGAGTEDMIARARKAGIPVLRIVP
jgi:hypothetical protein